MSRFKKLVRKVEAEGESAHEATAVAAIAGRKKYGKAGMARMADAGRKKELSLEGETGMLQNYSDEDVVTIMQQLVAEAILEGRLDNVDASEVEQAQEIGLSLGFVEQDSEGLALGFKTGAHGQAKRMAGGFVDITGTRKTNVADGTLRIKRRLAQAKLYNKGPQSPVMQAGRSARSFGRKVGAGARTFGKLALNTAKRHPLGTAIAGAAIGGIAARQIGSAKNRPLND